MRRTAMLVALGVLAGRVLADAKSDFEMLFGAEAKKVAATRSTADDAAFAAKLLEAGKSLADSPELQLLIYEKACAFGMRDPQGHAVALEALDLLARAMPGKSADLQARKLKLLELQFKSSRGPARKAAAKPYLEMLLAMAEAEAARGNAAEANGLYVKAFPIATYIRSPRTTEIVAKRRALAQELAAARRRQARLKTLQAKLTKDPEDTAARRELILLYLLEQDKPQEAARLVSDDLDETLRTYVPLAARPVEEIAEAACLELGAWYEQLAAKASPTGKATALRRAAACYGRYLAVHTKQDAPALKARMSLAVVEKSLAGLSAPRVKAAPGPPALTLDLGKGARMRLVLIPAGTFVMGSPKDEPGRSAGEVQHRVTISRAFYMGIYEVTQEQYEAVTGKNPSQFKAPKNPVEQVSWNDAVGFSKALSKKTGKTIRLPTEAQWEYACRGGTKTPFSFGNDERQLGDHAWYRANSGRKTHPVGQKKPNRAGLYDMYGNVWEWAQDWYAADYYGESPRTDPQGPSSGTARVVRGGSWVDSVRLCRSAFRHNGPPERRRSGIGFRVVCSVVSGVQ